jgi:hypothetical protein
MPDSRPLPRPITPIRLTSLSGSAAAPPNDSRPHEAAHARDGKMLCDRCGAEVYRMHAVWRCPVCGFKSDCCGW